MKVKGIIGYTEDGKAVLELEDGELLKINPPKFRNREVVSTTNKHYSQKELTRVLNPQYTENRGWVYVENYLDKNGRSGGCGMWIEEDLFQKPETLELRLKARKIEISEEISQLELNVKNRKTELSNIEFALSQ